MRVVLFIVVISICACFSFAQNSGDTEQGTVLNLDRIVRSKDANRAIELLESIEQKNAVYFNVTGGPFDKEQELFFAVELCSGFLSENTLDTHWGRLARIPIEDSAAIVAMLESQSAGERALALERLSMENTYYSKLEDQLRAVQQNDPLVYFMIPRGRMRFKNEPRDGIREYGKFVAHLRRDARNILDSQGAELEPEEEFIRRFEEFGVERLIEYYSTHDPDAMGGVFYNFYRMDPSSYGGRYLESLEHHKKLSDEHLNLLKQHLRKTMRLPGRVFPEDLEQALKADGGIFAVEKPPRAAAETAVESLVPGKDNASVRKLPVAEANAVETQAGAASVGSASQADEETTSNPWKFVFLSVGALLLATGAFFGSKKRR